MHMKAEQKRKEDHAENALKIEDIKDNVASEILNIKSTNEENVKTGDKERVWGIFADLKADYDDRLEKVQSENKQTHGWMMAKLEEMAKENLILSKKLKDKEKDENGRIRFKDMDLEPSEERKMIGDENDKTREKV